MSTWVIGQIHVHDVKEYAVYAAKVLPTMKEYQGKLLLVSDKNSTLEGEWKFPRTVIMEFPTNELAQAWYDSPAYQELIPIRQRSAKTNIVMVENALPSRA